MSLNHTFDRYLVQDSRLHLLDPRLKVVAALAFVLATLLLPDGAWLAYGLSWVCLWSATRLARLSYGTVFKRSLIVLPFLFTALTLLINTPGASLASWTIGPFTLTISQAGLVRFASVVIRGWLAVQAAVLLTAVTRFPDLIHALTHLRVPAVLVGILSFMYRYLFVLVDEAQRLLRARQARSAGPAGAGRKVKGIAQGGSLGWRARVAGYMVGQLFARSLDRSERVYGAMVSRGYRGRMLTMASHTMTRPDWLAGLAALLAIAAIQLLAWTLK